MIIKSGTKVFTSSIIAKPRKGEYISHDHQWRTNNIPCHLYKFGQVMVPTHLNALLHQSPKLKALLVPSE
jgi:hypothetical protein